MYVLGRQCRTALAVVVALTTAAIVLFAGRSAEARAAADGIPRPPGAIDGRGWELVSPVDDGAETLRGADLSESGNEQVAAAYWGGAGDAPTGAGAVVLSTRTANGWVSTGMTPPASERFAPIPAFQLATPDFSGLVQLDRIGYTGSVSPQLFLTRVIGGEATLLQEFGFLPGGLAQFLASDDLAHVFVNHRDEYFGFGETPGSLYVYDFGTGTPNLVSRLPGGSAPVCGVPTADTLYSFPSSGVTRWRTRMVSIDGGRAFFHTSGDDCSAAPELYMRDLVAGTTTLISGPLTGGTPSGAHFIQAATDGSWAFFLTGNQLEAADTDGSLDLYRHTVGAGNECLTCGAVPANVTAPAFNSNRTPRVAEDGTRAYFHSATVLAPGGTGNQNDIYVWREDGTISFVAPSNGMPPRAIDMTSDGSVLMFRSSNAALNALTGSDNGGQLQYYRYDDEDGSLACVSCPQDGSAATGGVTLTLLNELGTFASVEDRHAMSADGSILAFATTTSLDRAHDVNNDWDIYEWHDGSVGLITDGTSNYSPLIPGTEIALIDVSRDGTNIVFAAAAKLTHDPLPPDPAALLYTARIGGGFSAKVTATCVGDACQDPSPAPPGLDEPGSSSAAGGGNVSPAPILQVDSAVARGKAVVIELYVSHAGRVTVRGERLKRVRKAVRADGTYRLRVPLTQRARRALARRGGLVVRGRVGYRPADGNVDRVSIRVKVKG